jgi:hypothetical protein
MRARQRLRVGIPTFSFTAACGFLMSVAAPVIAQVPQAPPERASASSPEADVVKALPACADSLKIMGRQGHPQKDNTPQEPLLIARQISSK